MGAAGSGDAGRLTTDHYFVDRRPVEHMDKDTQEFSACPFAHVHKRFQEASEEGAVAADIGGRPCVFARGAAASQLFYDMSQQEHATSTHAMPECVQALLGKGTANCSVALLNGDRFMERKKEVHRAFSREAVEVYWGQIVKIMQKYMESWVKRGVVAMAKELEDLAFEISAACFIGATDPAHVHKLRTIAGGASVLDVAGDPAVSAAVRDALMEMIDEEMEGEQSIVDDGQHALDFLLEGEMDIDDMKVELCHFLLKGRDCLARALKCFAVELSRHEDVRQKVEEEAMKVGSDLSYSAAGSMIYTGHVIKEVKRLHPIGPLAWRVATEDVKLGTIQVAAGTRIALASTETHQDSSQYEEPTKFDPSRYKDRAEDKKNSGWCFIPHGTGVKDKVHRCPAEEFTNQVLKIFALIMSTTCQWKPQEDQDFTLDSSLTPADGLQFCIQKR